jgi:hypothetical protein
MCACKETDMRESPNNSTLAGREGQGGHGETCHLQYRESPISSVIEHPLVGGWRQLHNEELHNLHYCEILLKW